MRLLVSRTMTFYDADPWRNDVDLVDERDYVNSRTIEFPVRMQGLVRRWYQFQFALSLLRVCGRYDGFAVGRYGIWFPILQRLLRLGKRVVMTDTEWPKVKGGMINRAAALGSVAVCANTRVEIDRYSRHYKIPREKFRLVLLAFQRRDLREPRDGGYVFAGGIQGRDWETLVAAVDGLPYPVKLFTSSSPARAPSNMTVSFVSREAFYSEMAGAACVVVPLSPEPMAIRGNTVWTAAMAMGKVVIVTEPYGVPDYMEQGVSGFYVNYRDSHALRHYIELVMENAQLRERVGKRRARARVERIQPRRVSATRTRTAGRVGTSTDLMNGCLAALCGG